MSSRVLQGQGRDAPVQKGMRLGSTTMNRAQTVTRAQRQVTRPTQLRVPTHVASVTAHSPWRGSRLMSRSQKKQKRTRSPRTHGAAPRQKPQSTTMRWPLDSLLRPSTRALLRVWAMTALTSSMSSQMLRASTCHSRVRLPLRQERNPRRQCRHAESCAHQVRPGVHQRHHASARFPSIAVQMCSLWNLAPRRSRPLRR